MSRANKRAWQIQRGFDIAKRWLKKGKTQKTGEPNKERKLVR